MCKIAGYLIFILGGIGSFALGGNSLTMGLVCGFSTFISGALFIGLGEIIDQLTQANKYLYNMNEDMKRQNTNQSNLLYANSTSNNKTAPIPTSKPKTASNGGWICDKCKETNNAGTLSCKGCGAYK